MGKTAKRGAGLGVVKGWFPQGSYSLKCVAFLDIFRLIDEDDYKNPANNPAPPDEYIPSDRAVAILPIAFRRPRPPQAGFSLFRNEVSVPSGRSIGDRA